VGVATATATLALGLASHARADDPAAIPTVPPAPPAVAAPATPAAPTPPAVADATATVTQTAPSNLDVSVRVGSPGSDGAVTQTIAADAGSAAAAAAAPAAPAPAAPAPAATAPAAPTPAPAAPAAPTAAAPATAAPPAAPAAAPAPSAQPAPQAAAQAATTQTAPQNLNVSVRIASPGNDGPVTQTIAAGADAAAAAALHTPASSDPGQSQYQAPGAQYQNDTPSSPTADSPATPQAGSASSGSAMPSAPPAPSSSSLPSNWVWNWVWTCGDTTDSGITQQIDTGMDTWTWNWNLGGMCDNSSQSIPDIPTVISPVTPHIDLPVSVAPVNIGAPSPPEPPAGLLAATGDVAAPPPPPTSDTTPEATAVEQAPPQLAAAPRPPPTGPPPTELNAPAPHAHSAARLAVLSLPAPHITLPELRHGPLSLRTRLAATHRLAAAHRVAAKAIQVKVAPALSTISSVSTPSAAPGAAASSPAPHERTRHVPGQPKLPEPFLPLGLTGDAGASQSSSGGGLVPMLLALGLWVFFQPPALAAWWVPIRQRFPHSRAGDVPERPG
jgi:hypothetical protein